MPPYYLTNAVYDWLTFDLSFALMVYMFFQHYYTRFL